MCSYSILSSVEQVSFLFFIRGGGSPRVAAQLAHSQGQGLEPKAPTLLLGSSPAVGHTGASANTTRPRL